MTSIILIFDVETTGLLPKFKNTDEIINTEILPYITQLSYALYDINNDRLIKTYNTYIKLSNDIEISEKITEITGITRELLDKRGIDIIDALENLYDAYCRCDIVVAHNLDFDSRIIQIETKRNFNRFSLDIGSYMEWMFDEMYCKMSDIDLKCTMKLGVDLCNIEKTNSRGNYKKYPTLCELYTKLFNKTPNNLHNSMMDVLVCLRCYLKMDFNIDIFEDDFINFVTISM